MKNKTLEEHAQELYPKAEVRVGGRRVIEFFEVFLKSNQEGHSNTFKLKRTTNYDSEGKVAGIPEMKFEIDNTLMRMRLFRAVQDEIFKDELSRIVVEKINEGKKGKEE